MSNVHCYVVPRRVDEKSHTGLRARNEVKNVSAEETAGWTASSCLEQFLPAASSLGDWLRTHWSTQRTVVIRVYHIQDQLNSSHDTQ